MLLSCMFKLSNVTLRPMMRKLLARMCALSFLLLSLFPVPSQAQTASRTLIAAGPLHYNLSQEVTLNGTVVDVITKPSLGMLGGSHLLLTTLAGPADISLGAFGLGGEGTLSLARGQQVEVVGVIKAFKGNPVCLARVVKVGDHVYVIRNEHGIPITPQARKRASQNVQTGETR